MGKLLRNPDKPTAWTYFRLLLSGALMIVPVGLAGFGVAALHSDTESAVARAAALAFLGSSLPEEIMRFGVLCMFGLWRAGFIRPLDALIFGAVASLGFSAAENLLYGFSLGWPMALLKLAIATPIHLALGVVMAGFLVIAGSCAPARRGVMLALALALPVLLHGIYDLAILTAIGNAASGISDVVRLIPPVLGYSIVIGFAIWTARRAGGTGSGSTTYQVGG